MFWKKNKNKKNEYDNKKDCKSKCKCDNSCDDHIKIKIKNCYKSNDSLSSSDSVSVSLSSSDSFSISSSDSLSVSSSDSFSISSDSSLEDICVCECKPKSMKIQKTCTKKKFSKITKDTYKKNKYKTYILRNCFKCTVPTPSSELIHNKYCTTCYTAPDIICCNDLCKRKVKYINCSDCDICKLEYCESCYMNHRYNISCSSCHFSICEKKNLDNACSVCKRSFCSQCKPSNMYCSTCWIMLVCKRHTSEFPKDIMKEIIRK